MGERIESISNELDQTISTGNEKGGPGGNTSTEETGNPGRKRGRPRKDESPGATEEEKFPRMVNVEVPTPGEPKTEKKPPKKKYKPKPKPLLHGDNLEQILRTVSDIVSNRPGYEIWKLDDKEISQLSEPLANVLSRSSYLEKITDEYGDYVALCIAIGMIVIPRLLVQLKQNNEKRKEQKEIKPNGIKPGPGANTERNESTPIRRGDTRTIRENPHRNEIINPKFHESIPVI
jgi:hypothetical protein